MKVVQLLPRKCFLGCALPAIIHLALQGAVYQRLMAKICLIQVSTTREPVGLRNESHIPSPFVRDKADIFISSCLISVTCFSNVPALRGRTKRILGFAYSRLKSRRKEPGSVGGGDFLSHLGSDQRPGGKLTENSAGSRPSRHQQPRRSGRKQELGSPCWEM